MGKADKLKVKQNKRAPMACVACRSRKTRCSCGQPCKQCLASSRECVYEPVTEEENFKARQRKQETLARRALNMVEDTPVEVNDQFDGEGRRRSVRAAIPSNEVEEDLKSDVDGGERNEVGGGPVAGPIYIPSPLAGDPPSPWPYPLPAHDGVTCAPKKTLVTQDHPQSPIPFGKRLAARGTLFHDTTLCSKTCSHNNSLSDPAAGQPANAFEESSQDALLWDEEIEVVSNPDVPSDLPELSNATTPSSSDIPVDFDESIEPDDALFWDEEHPRTP